VRIDAWVRNKLLGLRPVLMNIGEVSRVPFGFRDGQSTAPAGGVKRIGAGGPPTLDRCGGISQEMAGY